jgi:hypothetical protein
MARRRAGLTLPADELTARHGRDVADRSSTTAVTQRSKHSAEYPGALKIMELLKNSPIDPVARCAEWYNSPVLRNLELTVTMPVRV